jgi:hypothetical protein
MAKGPKLKVFRMAVGFHDAYVAAPSQKAAAAAWGADLSVFSRGEAELVTDPKLIAEPLASPGKVVKRLRGTAEEQIAALPKDERAPPKRKAEADASPSKPRKAAKPKPRPSRARLDEAETAFSEAGARHRKEAAALAKREAALARERKAMEAAQDKERERLQAARDRAEAGYEEALRRWRAD